MSDRRLEILNQEHRKYISDKGMSSIYPKDFPLAYKDAAINAMDEYMKECCLELIEYMANNGVDCRKGLTQPVFSFNGKLILKEELFENFL